jgi:hypothetical protein
MRLSGAGGGATLRQPLTFVGVGEMRAVLIHGLASSVPSDRSDAVLPRRSRGSRRQLS